MQDEEQATQGETSRVELPLFGRCLFLENGLEGLIGYVVVFPDLLAPFWKARNGCLPKGVLQADGMSMYI